MNTHSSSARSGKGIRLATAAALLFGILTLLSGGNVLFGPKEARDLAGDYVPFVVWFNFLAGFAYILAAIGMWQNRAWAGWFAAAIAGATALVIIGFAVTVIRGSAFEMRTVGALAFRFLFWAMIAVTLLTRRKT